MIQPWMVIGGITFVVAIAASFLRPRDVRWAKRLDRPQWMFFEPAIPLIWTAIFVCGAISATLVWQSQPGRPQTWFLMLFYLVLEIITVAYIPATLWLRSLTIGTLLGGTGVILGILLAVLVWPISQTAGLLLLPYILWSPVGTYTTRRMIDLNPEAA